MESTLSIMEEAKSLSAPAELTALDSVLPQFETAAQERERVAGKLTAEAVAFRQIAEGIVALRNADAHAHSGNGAGVHSAPNGNGNGHANGTGPRGTAAVREVMKTGGYLSIQMVHESLETMGWVSETAKHPAKATETAIYRLLKAGEVERVGRGLYHYIGSPVDP